MPTITNGHLARIKSAVGSFYNLDKPSYTGKGLQSFSPSRGSERGDYTDVLRNAVAAVDAARAACPDIADQITIQRQAFLRNGSAGWRPTLTVYDTGRNETQTKAAPASTGSSAEMAAMASMMKQMTQMLAMVQASPAPEQPVVEQSDSVTLPPPAPEEQAYG